MSDGAFEPDKYQDDYRLRVLAMIDDKVKGREITTAPEPMAKPGPLIDLMEALRQSMKKVPEKKAAGAPRKTRKKLDILTKKQMSLPKMPANFRQIRNPSAPLESI
jgi:non-homologous end joining protein Ku